MRGVNIRCYIIKSNYIYENYKRIESRALGALEEK